MTGFPPVLMCKSTESRGKSWEPYRTQYFKLGQSPSIGLSKGIYVYIIITFLPTDVSASQGAYSYIQPIQNQLLQLKILFPHLFV